MMDDNSEPFDYEPLTRPRRRSAGVAEEFESVFVKPALLGRVEPGPRTPVSSELALKPIIEVPANPTRNQELSNTTVVSLKKGHALSFAGVFLFSLMLYFRPYELTSSLSWLSSSAFWIAVATIVIFLPTQLGLEGSLTTRTPEVVFVLLLTGLALLSIPLSLSPSVGLMAFADYVKVILIFIVMVNVVRTEKRLRALLLLTFVASLIMSVSALNDYSSGKLALQGTRIVGSFGGMFGNPNDLALHLVTMIPLAFALFLGTPNVIKKLFYGACVTVFVGGIVATFSRGGVLGLIAVIIVIAFKYVRRMRLLVVVGVVVLAFGLLAVAPTDFRSRLFTTGDASAVSRTDDLKRSLFLAARHPLLGIGLGNYVLYSNQAKATHNAYTQVAAEIGLIAATLYVLFVVAPLKPLLRIERETRENRKKPMAYYLSIGLQAAIVGYMVSSFFASVPYLWYSYYLVAYSIALRRIYDSAKAA